MSQLTKGRAVAPQEIHWWPHHAAQWRVLFPRDTVRYSCAVPGPHDGPEGGVASMYPVRSQSKATVSSTQGTSLKSSSARKPNGYATLASTFHQTADVVRFPLSSATSLMKTFRPSLSAMSTFIFRLPETLTKRRLLISSTLLSPASSPCCSPYKGPRSP